MFPLKKTVLLLFIIATNTALLQAQDTPFVHTTNPKMEWFKWEQKKSLPADTNILNQRYKPSANPLLLWKKDYPLTPEQIQARKKQKKQEESVLGILLKSRVKKNNSPVIPTL